MHNTLLRQQRIRIHHCRFFCSQMRLLISANPRESDVNWTWVATVVKPGLKLQSIFFASYLPSNVILFQIRPYVGCLVQYLPLLWKQSEEHNMLRCAILTTLIQLVQVWCISNLQFIIFALVGPVFANRVFTHYSIQINWVNWLISMRSQNVKQQVDLSYQLYSD